MFAEATGSQSAGHRNVARGVSPSAQRLLLNREMGASLSPTATLPLGNQHSESAAYYRAALAVRPDHAGAHQELGHILFSLGQIDDALAEYRRAVQLSPQCRAGRHYLVVQLARAGRWVEAAE